MEKLHFRLTRDVLFLLLLWLETCCCQQNALFNQTPYQRQSVFQRQQLRQRQPLLQQTTPQIFPNTLNQLNPITPLNTLSPITPLANTVLPQSTFRNYNQVNQQNFVPIVAYQNELNYDGSFAYGYVAGDGTTAQAQGYVKNLGLGEAVEAQVVQGSYSYTSPEGTPITVRYIADENGFRAEGAHIPTPPPIPEAIAQSLQYSSSIQPYQTDLSPNLNPYQTPFRQYPTNVRDGLGGQTGLPFQTSQQQQQQQRFLQQAQQTNSGQYQPDQGRAQNFATGINRLGSPFDNRLQNAGNFLQPNLTQQQQQQNQQQQQQQQQQNLGINQNLNKAQLDRQQHNDQQQIQQLATQELRGRPNQLVNPFGYSPYRRFKKAIKHHERKE